MKKTLMFNSSLKTVEGDESGKISGYASTYNNADLSGDVMLPGCYDGVLDKIKSSGIMPVMFFQHDHYGIPCGTWDEIHSDEKGLYVSGRINKELSAGKEIYSALKFGSLTGLSVGITYSLDGIEENDLGGYDYKSIESLMEISICAMPCNQNARIDSVKSFDIESIKDYKSAEKYLRDVGYFSREQAKKFISGLKAVFTAERDALRIKAAEQEIIDLIHSFTKKG